MGGHVSEISTKTSTKQYPDTVDSITANLCNEIGDCCSTQLGGSLLKGSVDTYTGQEQLEDCFNFIVGGGELTAMIMKTEDGSVDTWWSEWLKIKLSGDQYYQCPFHGPIDGEGFLLAYTMWC